MIRNVLVNDKSARVWSECPPFGSVHVASLLRMHRLFFPTFASAWTPRPAALRRLDMSGAAFRHMDTMDRSFVVNDNHTELSNRFEAGLFSGHWFLSMTMKSGSFSLMIIFSELSL